MEAVTIFRQRLNWTRNWLHDFKTNPEPIFDDFEVLSHHDAVVAVSDYGVKSLKSEYTPTETQSAISSKLDDTAPCQAHCRATCNCTGPECLRECMHLTCYACSGCCLEYSTVLSGPRQPDEDEYPYSPWIINDKAATNYEFAGRRDLQNFGDLRSAAKARNRTRRQNKKYFNYTAVKPGWLDQPFRDLTGAYRWYSNIFLAQEAPVCTMTKKMMFQEAQQYPRPPTYHRRRKEKDYSPWRTRKGWRHRHGRKFQLHWVEEEVVECEEEKRWLQRDPEMWTSPGWPWGPDSCSDSEDLDEVMDEQAVDEEAAHECGLCDMCTWEDGCDECVDCWGYASWPDDTSNPELMHQHGMDV